MKLRITAFVLLLALVVPFVGLMIWGWNPRWLMLSPLSMIGTVAVDAIAVRFRHYPLPA